MTRVPRRARAVARTLLRPGRARPRARARRRPVSRAPRRRPRRPGQAAPTRPLRRVAGPRPVRRFAPKQYPSVVRRLPIAKAIVRPDMRTQACAPTSSMPSCPASPAKRRSVRTSSRHLRRVRTKPTRSFSARCSAQTINISSGPRYSGRSTRSRSPKKSMLVWPTAWQIAVSSLLCGTRSSLLMLRRRR